MWLIIIRTCMKLPGTVSYATFLTCKWEHLQIMRNTNIPWKWAKDTSS
jgi:hypothetical protein